MFVIYHRASPSHPWTVLESFATLDEAEAVGRRYARPREYFLAPQGPRPRPSSRPDWTVPRQPRGHQSRAAAADPEPGRGTHRAPDNPRSR